MMAKILAKISFGLVALVALGALIKLSSGAVVVVSADQVWDQMKNGEVGSVRAQITGVDVLTDQVRVEYSVREGKQVIKKSTKLCEGASGHNTDSATASDTDARAAYLQARISVLRDAFKSKEHVKLGFSSPGGDCLQLIRLEQK
jgi:hypothetical protein